MAIRFPGEPGPTVTPHVRRSERRWAIAIGGREIAVTRSSYSWALTAPAPDRRLLAASPRPTIARSVGTVLALLAGVTTIAIAVQSGRASAGGRYVLSLAVPPAPARSVEVPPARPRHHVAVRRVTAAAAPAVAAPDADPAEAVDGDADPTAGAPTLATRQQAIAAALGSGRMAQWTGDAGNERGFIIAGPLESGADGECRALSVLVRRFGEPDSVEKRRDCLPRVHRGGAAAG